MQFHYVPPFINSRTTWNKLIIYILPMMAKYSFASDLGLAAFDGLDLHLTGHLISLCFSFRSVAVITR